MKTEEIISSLAKGGKQEIKEATRQIEKIQKGKNSRYPQEYKEIMSWVIDNFDGIESTTNKIAILKALQLPLMYLGSRDYGEISKFVLKVLQDADGRVREQAYNSATWFLIDITPDRERRGVTEKRIDIKTEQFVDFILRVDKAAKQHVYEANGRKFLNGMKPCIYKSLQRTLCRGLTNEWLLKIVHKAGYRESPSYAEIFASNIITALKGGAFTPTS